MITEEKVSVIIPTYNRAGSLRITLPSYLQNEDIVGEVIIIIDGSMDNSYEVVQEFLITSKIPIKVIKNEKKLGAQICRKIGVNNSSYPYVLFGEDDVYLTRDYVPTLYREINEYNADIIGGKIVNLEMEEKEENKVLKIIDEFLKNHKKDSIINVTDKDDLFDPILLKGFFHLNVAKPLEVPFLHAISLIRKSVFEYAQFDDFYKGNGFREETDFYLSAKKRNAKIFYTSDAFCLHLRFEYSYLGGQRISKLERGVFAMINTNYMLKKHWDIISKEFNIKFGRRIFMTLYTLKGFYRLVRKILLRERV